MTVARHMLRDREGSVEHGTLVNPRANRITFEEAAENLLTDYRANGRRSIGEAERRIRLHLEPVFRKRKLGGITTDRLRAFVGVRQAAGAANGEINRELSVLRRMFSLARQDGLMTHRPHFPMLRENNVRTGFFEHDQYLEVVRQLPSELRPVITFAYSPDGGFGARFCQFSGGRWICGRASYGSMPGQRRTVWAGSCRSVNCRSCALRWRSRSGSRASWVGGV